ncbi:unnamed protein product [Phytomonas sp. Hart1]|nr:unnamed protein product [Phytomonas sp. Hart1]|eukprot:CCW66706.1 unnamed protein product [Phytomonas sp. isolate Hart1]
MSRESESPYTTKTNSIVSYLPVIRRRSPGVTSYSSSIHATTALPKTDRLSENLLKNYVVELAKENSEMIKKIVDLQRERKVLEARLIAANAMKTNIVSNSEKEHTIEDTKASGWNCTRGVALTENLLKDIRSAIECKACVSDCTYNGMQVVFDGMKKQAVNTVVFDRDKKLQKQLTGLSQSISRSVCGDNSSEGGDTGAPGEAFVLMNRVVAPATERVDQFMGLCMDLLFALYRAHACHH